jgi:hypothetical protein
VSFTGLRKQSPGETNAAASGGVLISNEDAVVSFSFGKGIQVSDKKSPEHVSVSLPVLSINLNNDQNGSAQAIAGTLVGTRQDDSDWEFAGTGKLEAVRFAMTNLDLEQMLAVATSPSVANPMPPGSVTDGNYSRERLADRLAAAATITDPEIKDKSLATLAEDAAKAVEMEVMKSALSQMTDIDKHDVAAHESARLLAKAGHLKQAIETAKGISDSDLRDKALAELAQ